MARLKKTVTPKETEAPKEAEAPKAETKKKPMRFAGKKYSYFHPFQQKWVPMGGDGVELELDSWLKSQIEAGLIEKL